MTDLANRMFVQVLSLAATCSRRPSRRSTRARSLTMRHAEEAMFDALTVAHRQRRGGRRERSRELMDSDSGRGEGGNDPTHFLSSLSVWERREERREDDLRTRRDDGAAFYPRLTNRWPAASAAFLMETRIAAASCRPFGISRNLCLK